MCQGVGDSAPSVEVLGGIRPPGARVMGGCEMHEVGVNSGPLTTKPCPQPMFRNISFKRNNILISSFSERYSPKREDSGRSGGGKRSTVLSPSEKDRDQITEKSAQNTGNMPFTAFPNLNPNPFAFFLSFVLLLSKTNVLLYLQLHICSLPNLLRVSDPLGLYLRLWNKRWRGWGWG